MLTSLKAPIFAALSITKKCNLKCVHCYASGGERDKNELTDDELKNVIKQLIDMGILNIDFLGGEPFERENFPELIQMVIDAGLRLNVTTNGTLITEDWLDKYGKNISLLRIALDSPIPEEHDKFRGVPGSWHKTYNSVKSAVDRKINVTLVTTYHRKNTHQLSDMVSLAANLGVAGYANTCLFPSGRGKSLEEDVFSVEDMKEFLTEWGNQRKILKEKNIRLKLIDETPITILLADKSGYENEYLTFKANCANKTPTCRACTAGLLQVHLTPTGHLIPCGGMEGIKELQTDDNDVRLHSIEHIWKNSWIFNAMRDRLYTDKPYSINDKCNKCEFLQYCGGGCRAAAYLTHGNFEKADSFCWYEPK
ncbi:radical SAM/SPASM domain-containing protein [Clostridium omnivorum]|uniref:Radical SAM/SPASM domain-containing protein n=1 Tax=Clostridium omnivorum TaxID=1604902 RepID=A0ABQ5N4D8_9CLOT|nr:radical SAM protein [Clostridium sp. E14]GLC30102.1 radical SAM/SPASM domain-containing protein [Clostridium sp. E14]